MKRLLTIGSLFIGVGLYALVFSQQQESAFRCSLDGSRILPQYEVSIVQKDGAGRSFSCVLSARIWFGENWEQVSLILVTDELTGKKIEARQAFYVVSDVITTAYTGNKIHVFSRQSDAALHARHFNGTFVKNPFHVQKRIPARIVTYKPHSPDSADYLLSWAQKKPVIATGPTFFQKQTPYYLFHRYLLCLSTGYHSPPDRPPKHITFS